MARSKECPKCGADISESWQDEDPDVGIGAGWYCDTCDEAYGDEDEPEHHDDDVPLFGTGGKLHLVQSNCCPKCLSTNLEMGFGLAGGGIGSYMYCPKCSVVAKDPEV